MKEIFKVCDTPLTDKELADWLRAMRDNPHVPESHYDVSVIFKTTIKNKIYYFAGVNVESGEHRLSTHGEEGALSAMVTALGKYVRIEEAYVMAAPESMKQGDSSPLAHTHAPSCGKCRQVMANLAVPNMPVQLFSLNGGETDKQTRDLDVLLPEGFKFEHWVPGLNKERDQALKQMEPPSEEDIRKRLYHIPPRNMELKKYQLKPWLQSLESFDFATKRTDSVILKLSNGAYVAGTKIEEAAFNGPSATEVALANANALFGDMPFTVMEVFSFSKTRGEVPGSVRDRYHPLSGSDMQTLREHGATGSTSITTFNSGGNSIQYRLRDIADIGPTAAKPWITALEVRDILKQRNALTR